MSKLTKGTHLFFIDPADRAVTRVTGLTNLNLGGVPADQIEKTDLDELETKQYDKGLRTPGQATGTVLADPTVAAHIRLHEMVEDGSIGNVEWVVGWGDGTSLPTADSNGNFNLPNTRTWYQFDGYVSDFPFDFQLNANVSTALTIQRSGGGTWQKKV